MDDIQKKVKSLEKTSGNDELNEITLEISDNNSEAFKLKSPNDVYIEIYKKSLNKGKTS